MTTLPGTARQDLGRNVGHILRIRHKAPVSTIQRQHTVCSLPVDKKPVVRAKWCRFEERAGPKIISHEDQGCFGCQVLETSGCSPSQAKIEERCRVNDGRQASSERFIALAIVTQLATVRITVESKLASGTPTCAPRAMNRGSFAPLQSREQERYVNRREPHQPS